MPVGLPKRRQSPPLNFLMLVGFLGVPDKTDGTSRILVKPGVPYDWVSIPAARIRERCAEDLPKTKIALLVF